MTRWFDDEDPRVKADRQHEVNKKYAHWFHHKGRQALGAKQDKKARMFRDKFTRDNIGFKTDLARRERRIPITLPKVGG